MKQPRFGAYAVAIPDQTVIVTEGADGSEVSMASFEIYSPASRSWRDGPSNPDHRQLVSAACCAGSVYVVGGYGDYSCCRDCLRFDLGPSTWSTLPVSFKLSCGRQEGACCVFVLP